MKWLIKTSLDMPPNKIELPRGSNFHHIKLHEPSKVHIAATFDVITAIEYLEQHLKLMSTAIRNDRDTDSSLPSRIDSMTSFLLRVEGELLNIDTGSIKTPKLMVLTDDVFKKIKELHFINQISTYWVLDSKPGLHILESAEKHHSFKIMIYKVQSNITNPVEFYKRHMNMFL